ncbi:MAG: prolipoprotein diacylglyceryl transferase [Acidimicrobiia bacterium]
MLAEAWLDYDPIVHIEIGPLNISPHGVGIAIGFLLGAAIFLRWCRTSDIPEDAVYSMINRAAIGSIIGARLAYVMFRPQEFFPNVGDIFAVWEGGISLLGGIAGAILLGVPKMRAEGLSFWKVMDLAVPCVAVGIIIGRIGDLVVADHLGKPSGDFFLGFVCRENPDDMAVECIAGPGEAVYQPALFDLFSATVLFLVLLRLRKTKRYDGFLTVFFGAWYGAGRLVEDFFRIDETYGFGLTGSQWTAVTVMSLCLYVLLVKRDVPWRSGRGTTASAPAGQEPRTTAPRSSGQ